MRVRAPAGFLARVSFLLDVPEDVRSCDPRGGNASRSGIEGAKSYVTGYVWRDNRYLMRLVDGVGRLHAANRQLDC